MNYEVVENKTRIRARYRGWNRIDYRNWCGYRIWSKVRRGACNISAAHASASEVNNEL